MVKRYCAKCKNNSDEYTPSKMMWCGIPDFICDTCKEEGWYSTRGNGGPPTLVNSETDEVIPQKI